MSHIHDTRNQPLSSLVNRLNLDKTTNDTKELRSKGNDLYVKQGKAFFTSTTSRANHRAKRPILFHDRRGEDRAEGPTLRNKYEYTQWAKVRHR